MPKIQEYGPSRVTSQNVPQPRAQSVPSGAFGYAIGEGLGNLAAGLQDFAERRDVTAAEDALVNFEREKNKLFFDPQSGYFNSQGRAAYDGAKGINTQLDDLRKRYVEGLETDGSRRAFDKVAQQHVTRGRSDIMQHATKGLNAWEVATLNASVENTIENASLYYNQPEELKVQHELGRQAVIDAAKREGIDGEALGERLQTYTSGFYASAVATSIDKGYAQGKAALDKARDGKQLEGPDLRKLEKALEAKRKSEETESNAATAITMYRDIYNKAADQTEAMEMVEKIQDPKLYKAVRNELRTRYAQDKQDQTVVAAAAWDEAEDHVYMGGNALTFQFENPELYERLSPSQKAKLETGELTVTDPMVMTNIRMMSLDQLKRLDLSQYSQSLSLADRKVIQKMKDDALEGKFDASLQTEAAEFKAFSLQYFDKASESDLKPDQLEDINNMRLYVENRLADYKQQNKVTTVPREQYRKILNELLFKTPDVVAVDWGLDKKVTFDMIPSVDRSGNPIIPQLRDALLNLDPPRAPTATNMLMLWSKNYEVWSDDPY